MKLRHLWPLAALICAAGANAASNRIIVKWRTDGIAAVQLKNINDRAARLQLTAGRPLHAVRRMFTGADVYHLDRWLGGSQMQALLARLNADPSVQYAEADEMRYAEALPNDPRFYQGSDANGQWAGQWYLGDPSSVTPAAIGATTAWDTATGTGVTVAVVDTGVRLDHPDLAGQLLPGRDFVCNDDPNTSCLSPSATMFLTANDGDSWDTDPSDPGDWISSTDLSRSDKFFAGCGGGTAGDVPEPSSWHGTRVAGILGAATNNGIGIAGVAPGVRILPIRALGKCGGYTSDIVDGMLWAARLTVTSGDLASIAANPAPNQAQIINLSLGSDQNCTQTEQDAVTALVNAGVVVVASAGNSGGPVGAPANCTGVISVAGLRHVGSKVGYSNVSSASASISIAAPAGNCVNVDPTLPCVYSIDTLSDDGDTVPQNPFYTYSLFNSGYGGNANNAPNVGTSFAAPMVSGVLAMMVEANPHLTVAQLTQRLQAAATPFPSPTTTAGDCHVATGANDLQVADCRCTTATCGAGMLNATAAVDAADRPIANLVSSATSATIGQNITLDGSGSAAAGTHQIVAYHWSSSPSVNIANADQASANFVFPAFRNVTVTLTVTDNLGLSDSSSLVITTPNFPQDGTGSGGGGGAMGVELAELALLALLARRRPRAVTRSAAATLN